MDNSLEAVSSWFPNDAGECHDRRTGGPKKSKKKKPVHILHVRHMNILVHLQTVFKCSTQKQITRCGTL